MRAKSAKEGEMHWTGKVQGGKVSGKVVWAKQGQKAINYVFAGALKK